MVTINMAEKSLSHYFSRKYIKYWRWVARGLPVLLSFFYIPLRVQNELGLLGMTVAGSSSRPWDKFDTFSGSNLSNPCGTIAERDVDGIQLHVFAWKRPDALLALLDQLESSRYKGWKGAVPLHVHVDGGADEVVPLVLKDFKWSHGRKVLDVRQESVGLREMWLSSLGPAAREAGDNTLMIVFEDDMVVSPEYFQWILAMIDQYSPNRRCRDKNLMGFSLSPIKMEEMKKPFTRWNSRKELGVEDLAYLSLVPSSWGAAYWSDRWEEFDQFVQVRSKLPFYNAENEKNIKGFSYETLDLSPEVYHIPDARSNFWPKSWKRFMVDWMYGRGLLMLYPSLHGEKGLATTAALAGEHVGAGDSNNPRVAELEDNVDRKELRFLMKPYHELPVLGLHLEPRTREGLVTSGTEFLQTVHKTCSGCDSLIKLWARPEVNIQQKPLQICAPDLYMSASTPKFLETQKTRARKVKERYLLFEPQYGGNNQIFAIVEAMAWAKVLGRKLIMPPLFLPRVLDFEEAFSDWPDTTKIFKFDEVDVPGFNKEPISFNNWYKLKLPVNRIVRISRYAVFDKPTKPLTDVILQTYAPKGTEIQTVDLRHIFDNRGPFPVKDVKQLLGGCNDEVLAIEGMFFANIDINGDKWNQVKFSKASEGLYWKVKKSLQQELDSEEYACFHVRLGDFVDMCESISKKEMKEKMTYFADMLEKGYECHVKEEELNLAMQTLGMPALIMSNGEHGAENSGLTLATSEWVKDAVSKHLPKGMNEAEKTILDMVMEQQLCAGAKVAVLNRFSTVSKRIEKLRAAKGIPSHFWSNHVQKFMKEKRAQITGEKQD